MGLVSRTSVAAFLLIAASAGGNDKEAFAWNFNASADAVSPTGVVRKAETERELRFADGVSGRALELAGNPSPFFDAKGLFESKGTLSFWYSAGFSGGAAQAVQHLFTLTRENGRQFPFAWFHRYEGLSFRIPTQTEEILLKTAVSSFEQIQKNDWVHIALSWGERNWATVYVNGVATNWKRFSGVDFSDIVKLTFGTPERSKNAFQGRIDEIKLFRHPLTEEEVFREYASHALADAWMDQSLFPANRKIRPEVLIAPLGTLRGNNPKAPWMGIPFRGSAELSLKDSAGKLLAERKWENLAVAKMETLRLPEQFLSPGRYLLELKMRSAGGAATRFFDICLDDMKLNNPEDEEIRLGPPVWSCGSADFSSTKPVRTGELDGIAFTEGGAGKGDRIFCELKIPKRYTSEQLLCLEIEWPDDKARAMGLYLYPPKGSLSQIRDRLGGGICTGGEYPVSGRMRKTSWLFYAGYTDWLFEIRTAIAGRPAAVAGVRILPVEGPLPRLKINLPEGLPGRRIGHLDEDQSFDYNLDWDNARRSADPWKIQSKTIRLLLNYYAYTGQNLFTLPLMRYSWTDYARIYSPCRSMGPLNKAGYWLDRLRENQIDFIAIVNLMNVPELQNLKRGREYRRKGMTSASVEGPLTGLNRNNPIHPENRKMLLAHLDEFMRREGRRPEISGIDFWCEWPIVSFQNLEHGYDDYTVAAFSRETGVNVPDFADDVYRRRWRFLTSAPVRAQWTRWRVSKTTEIFREIRRVIDNVSRGKPLYITVSLPRGKKDDESMDSLDMGKYLYEEKSIDLKALNALPDTTVVPMRHGLEQIWNLHWNGNITVSDEAQNNPLFTLPFRRPDRNYVNCYRTYFETFSQSAMPEKYPSVFQNIELKPVGRHFLKELSLALAFNDAQRIAVGAQPLVSMGREKEMREFVKAYRALPDLPFRDVPGAFDPVTVRWRETKNGVYLYAVNMIRSELSVGLKVSGALSMKDLSSSGLIPLSGDGEVSVSLKPFELRSFLLEGNPVPELQGVRIPEAFEKSCAEELRSLSDIRKQFSASGAGNPAVAERLRKCAAALADRRYAEFDRLLNSKLLRMLVRNRKNLVSGVIQDAQKQLARHSFRINCGSSEYLRASSGVFMPDRKWSESAPYGYLGDGANAIERPDNLPPGNPLRRLFLTELYAVTGYRFRVPESGTYTLRLYQRVGYEAGRKKGNFVVDISVNGKMLRRNYDIFANESENTGMALLTLSGIVPVNGMVTLEMKPSGGRDKTVVLLNGIELEKEK